MLSPPFWLNHTLFLCLDEPSVKLIQMPAPALPHVLAVEKLCGEEKTGAAAEDDDWTGSFKVGMDDLVTELYPLIGYSTLSPYEVGMGVTPDLVWTGIGRNGREHASVQ